MMITLHTTAKQARKEKEEEEKKGRRMKRFFKYQIRKKDLTATIINPAFSFSLARHFSVEYCS